MSDKKALLIGINYMGTSSALRGCINDVNRVSELLLKKGYDITLMTDFTDDKPTRSNIVAGLKKLISSSASQLFFHYSGHGSWIPDYDGDESDGRDECLVPLDYQTSGMIVDDEIKIMLMDLRKDQKLFAVLDCCHSGTGMDLRYNLYSRVGGSQLRLIKDGRISKTPGQCILLSGCKDSQTSADAYINSTFQGAMTNAFLKAYPKATSLKDLIKRIRKILKKGHYSQIPNLSTGRKTTLKEYVDF